MGLRKSARPTVVYRLCTPWPGTNLKTHHELIRPSGKKLATTHYSLPEVGLRLAPLWKNSLHVGERGRLPGGVPLSLHELEGWHSAGEGELKLDLAGDGVCRKVNTECAGEKVSTPSGIHRRPGSLRHGGGGGIAVEPAPVLSCDHWGLRHRQSRGQEA